MKTFYVSVLALLSFHVGYGQSEQSGPGMVQDQGNNDLAIGRILSYHLRIDQHVMNDKGVCVPAVYQLEIVDRDEVGNVRVVVKMRTMRDLLKTDTLLFSKQGEMSIIGVRLAWASPQYEATLDSYGRIMMASHDMVVSTEDGNTMGSVISRTTDSEAQTSVVMTFPTEYALLAPFGRGASMTLIGKDYTDTLSLRSAIQNIGHTFGPEKTVVKSEKRDTLLRTVRVDSLTGIGNDQIAYMSVTMKRIPAYGTISISQASMERYVQRGYMRAFSTTNRMVTNSGLKVDYIATSVLERTWMKNSE